MAQFARPAVDVTRNSWVTHASGTANLWATLDEDVADDADFVQGSLTANDFYEVRLSTVTAALIDRGHVLRYRGRKSAAAGHQRGVTVELRQGATVIASNSHTDLTAIFADGAILLTKEQGAAITDYADLRVRFTSTGNVGSPSGSRRRVQMSWCQFRVPDWQPTWEVDWGAEEDLSTPGVVRLTLDGETVEGADSDEARWLLAARLRDRVLEQRIDVSQQVYDTPAYQTWGFRRYPLAHYRRKVAAYTGVAGAEDKLARCQAIVDSLTAQELA